MKMERIGGKKVLRAKTQISNYFCLVIVFLKLQKYEQKIKIERLGKNQFGQFCFKQSIPNIAREREREDTTVRITKKSIKTEKMRRGRTKVIEKD